MDTNALRNTLLQQYQVRKTDTQKSAFIDWACQYAQDCGIPVTVEESGKYIRSRNIIFGDAEKARTIITAHYDTCARMLLPNFSTPGCLPLFVLEQVVLTLMIGLGGWLAGRGGYALAIAHMHPLAAGLISAIAGTAAPSASICVRPSMQSAIISKESPSVARLVSSDMTLVENMT